MKKHICILQFFLSVFLFVSAQQQEKNMGEFLYTVPLDKKISLKQLQTEWWHEYLEWPVHEELFQQIIKSLQAGELTAFFPQAPFDKQMTLSETYKALNTVDSAAMQNPYNEMMDVVVISRPLEPYQVSSITFCEEWFFNATSFEIKKKVKGFILNKYKVDRNTGEYKGENPLFFIPADKNFNTGSNSGKTVPRITYNLNLAGSFLSENNDAVLNSKFQFLLSAICSSINTHMDLLYDTLFPYTKTLDKKSLENVIGKAAKANNIKFYEEWVFDISHSVFEKKVKGIVLLDEKKDAQGKVLSRKDIAFVAANGFKPLDVFSKTVITVGKQQYSLQTGNFTITHIIGMCQS